MCAVVALSISTSMIPLCGIPSISMAMRLAISLASGMYVGVGLFVAAIAVELLLPRGVPPPAHPVAHVAVHRLHHEEYRAPLGGTERVQRREEGARARAMFPIQRAHRGTPGPSSVSTVASIDIVSDPSG